MSMTPFILLSLLASGAQIDCPLGEISDSARVALAISSRPAADGDSPPIPADARAEVGRAVDICAARHGWNRDQRWEATTFTLNSIARDELAKIATARGVDPAKVEAAVRALPAAKRSPLEPPESATAQGIRAALAAQGIDMADSARAGAAMALARAWSWLLFVTDEG